MQKSLETWLDELADRHPQHNIRLGLERMHEAMNRLHLKQPDTPVVTIAGTNGKGSCLMLLERLLVTNNQRVGCFQSPHISSFCERIRVNGANADADAIARSFDRIDASCSDLGLTFFEWITLAALDIFSQSKLDLLLLEIGLGGRLDSVNAIDNQLSIITAIDYDHMDWLGDTLPLIAGEKAGVIRAGSKVVSHSQISSITEKVEQLQADACYWQKDFSIEKEKSQPNWLFDGMDNYGHSVTCSTPMPAGCIADNLAMALQGWLSLGFLLTDALTEKAFSSFVLPCRQQHIKRNAYDIILDVAHNGAGLKALSTMVSDEFGARPAVAIIGMLVDKSVQHDMLALFPSVRRWILLTLTGARGQTAEKLRDRLSLGEREVEMFDSLDDVGIEEIMRDESLLIATGSFHTCDKVKAMLERS